MGIIFLKADGRQLCQLTAGGVRLIAVAAAGCALALFFAGIKYGIESVRVPPTGAVSVWHRDLALQEAEVREAVRDSQDSLHALAARLGRLQAQSMRLEALGERLVDAAELDPEEFAFDRPPALGGRAPEGRALVRQPIAVGDFLAELQRLERRLADRAPKLEALESVLKNRELNIKTRPSGRPVKQGWRSSSYGYRTDPVNGRRMFHHGLDFAGRPGSEVIAVAAGIVAESGRRAGYGRTVIIQHGGGYESRYAHNRKNLVKPGQVVHKGQIIALMGSTGRSTGTHVHFEILHNGEPVNPSQFIGR